MNERNRPHVIHTALGLSVLGITTACQSGDGPGTFTVTDSAGIAIVTSTEALWSDDTSWRVDTTPSLSIGTLGGEPEYELFKVSQAVRFKDGTIGVVNRGTQELRFYDATGRYLRSVGRNGEGPGEFRNPTRTFPLAGDSVAVWDPGLRRMSVFDGHGTFARSFALGSGDQLFSAEILSGRTLLAGTNIPYDPDAPAAGPRRDTILYVIFDLDGDSLSALGLFPGDDHFIRAIERGVIGTMPVFGRSSYRAAFGPSWFVGNNDGYIIDELDGGGTCCAVSAESWRPSESLTRWSTERSKRASPA